MTAMFSSHAKVVNKPSSKPSEQASTFSLLDFMKQAGKMRQMVARLQQRIKSALKDKNSGSLFAADDSVDDLIVAVKADLSSIPAQIIELGDKGKNARVSSDVLKAVISIFQTEMLEAGRDFSRLIEKHAQATKTKEDRRSKLEVGRIDGSKNS